MTLEEKQAAVIEDFSLYDQWLDKYEYLIELGKNLEPYPEDKKTEDKLIKGFGLTLRWKASDSYLPPTAMLS